MKLESQTFILRINVENAMFTDNMPMGNELARILRELAKRIENDNAENLWGFQNVRDVNGNVVGQFAVKPAEYEV